MAVTPPPAFTVDGAVGTSFGSASSRVALPGSSLGTDTLVRICNLGPCALAFALGGNTVVATNNGSPVVMPGQTEFFALPAGATYIAGVSCGGPGTGVTANVSTGN